MKTYYYDAKVTEGFCMVIKNRSGQGLRRRAMMIDMESGHGKAIQFCCSLFSSVQSLSYV